MPPKLCIIIPCFNEEQVLLKTAPKFLKQLTHLITDKKIASTSKIMFVDDGSSDQTWSIIEDLSKQDSHFIGIAQSRNRGHQNAVLAGLMEAKDFCDITISIDCDGQDDISAMEAMVDEYKNGSDIVYGVRSSRKTDKFFKRFTAQAFYKLLNFMGVDIVYNHADYRLVSSRALQEFANFKEVNLFLRGMFPLVGFKTSKVYYERNRRLAGESHYPLNKMLSLALNGITSLSIKPIRMIFWIGLLVALLSLCGIIWSLIAFLSGKSISGWASLVVLICFFGGIQILCIGVVGEYIGKIYLETKARPRYIISRRTYEQS